MAIKDVHQYDRRVTAWTEQTQIVSKQATFIGHANIIKTFLQSRSLWQNAMSMILGYHRSNNSMVGLTFHNVEEARFGFTYYELLTFKISKYAAFRSSVVVSLIPGEPWQGRAGGAKGEERGARTREREVQRSER